MRICAFLLTSDPMSKMRTLQAQTTRRVDGGVEVGPRRRNPEKGGEKDCTSQKAQDTTRVGGAEGKQEADGKFGFMHGKVPKKIQTTNKWLSDDEDRLLLAIKESEKAIGWECLRHLYFAQEMSPFWRCWIEEGDTVALQRFRRLPVNDEEFSFPVVDSQCAAILKKTSFPGKSWRDLDDVERFLVPNVITHNSPAVKPLLVSASNFYGFMEWAYHELMKCKKEFSPFDEMWGPIIERTPIHQKDRSQIIIEIDWSQGKEAIQKAFMAAIQPLLTNRFPKGRKARSKDSRHFFKGLVVLRRRKCRALPWGEATRIERKGGEPTRFIFGKDGRGDSPAARQAMSEAERALALIKGLLADEEQRLCNGWDMKKWARELAENSERRERIVAIPIRDQSM